MNKSLQYEAVRTFHEKYGLTIQNHPKLPDHDIRNLRVELLKEEFQEYLDGEKSNDIIEISDALADMIYIIYGTAISYGIPLDEVFQEVQRSNMSKLDENGNAIKREDGKILKGPYYTPPDIRTIIQNHTSNNE